MRTAALALLALAACAPPLREDDGPSVLDYFAGLARPDGGYGWADEPTGHLTPTCAAVAAHAILKAPVPRAAQVAEFARTHHPYRGPHAESKRHAAEIRGFIWQATRTLQFLGADASMFAEEVRGWTKPSTYPVTYERQGNPPLQQEAMAVLCRRLLGMDVPPAFAEYFESRRRPDGTYNNTPASDGTPGHLMNTLWGLEAERPPPNPTTIAWLQEQRPPSVDAAWAVVRGLALLGARPARPDRIIDLTLSFRRPDGGFGQHLGRPSDPLSTLRALETLEALGALDRLGPPPPRRAPAPLPPGLRPFTIQLEAPGQGSPSDAVELARALGIHLWGAKNAKPGWIARAQEIARERKVPVTFFVSDEEYGTFITLPGHGSYSHVADLMAPGSGIGPPVKDASWEDYRTRRIEPLERAGGAMVWQICDNEEFSCELLDSGAYAAIATFHMRQNFADILPFVMKYRGAIPFVALQDAHGIEPWSWADDLAGYRSVFLAKEPTWEGWREALRRDWVVAVRRDETTKLRTRMLGGTPEARELIRAGLVLPARPMVVLAAESTRPVALRVRVAHANSPQGVLLKPLAELVSLTLNGQPQKTALRRVVDAKNQVLDLHHSVDLPDLPAGRHIAEALVRVLATHSEERARLEFTIP